MKALILLVPIIVLAVIWYGVVRYRGKLAKPTAHAIGAILGLIVGVLVLSAVLPEPTDAEVAQMKQDDQAVQEKDAHTQQEQAQAKAAEAAIAARQVPNDALDKITLVYMKHKVYAKGSVDCTSKMIGERSIIGCRNNSLDGKSALHIWEYSGGKFKSLNGSARGLAETKFSNEPLIEVAPLPLPADIDVGAIVEQFKKA